MDNKPALFQLGHSIDITPEDIFGGHVNNARFFAFINLAFQEWYNAMGIGKGRPQGPAMARMEYDFLAEVHYPARLICRLTVERVGRASLTHRIEMFDLAQDRRLCGQGRAVNVWTDRQSRTTAPWPPEMLAKCWPAA